MQDVVCCLLDIVMGKKFLYFRAQTILGFENKFFFEYPNWTQQ